MNKTIEQIVNRISEKNPLHSKKIKKTVKNLDSDYFKRAGDFLDKYNELLKKEGKDMDYAVDCYLQMIADVHFESVHFLESGEYTSKSFDEVNKRVYDNPEVMTYYMHGLLLSQFLWKHHYDILLYFNGVMKENKGNIKNYLEIGGGHGLYISEAVSILGKDTRFDLVDISSSSLDIAKRLINNDAIHYIHSDIFKYHPAHKYDFITMGEVLEHVEDPVGLLKQLNFLLADNGKVFITTPTNAPAIDHIYLFKSAEDIRNVIHQAGFKIEKELCIFAEDLPPELLEQYKISMMFAGVLTKSK